jgi:hypothetical protein
MLLLLTGSAGFCWKNVGGVVYGKDLLRDDDL